jgi:type IV secretory pathway VirJ component
MRRLALVALLLVATAATAGARGTEETLTFGRFGTVTLYRATPTPEHVVLFVSGDGGWNKGVVDMARLLVPMDSLVVGIDIRHYLGRLGEGKESCAYAAADFEALSQLVQKKLGYTAYHPPLLIGYSSGATLVYALLVQAPPGTFAGAISLGFCPDLDLPKPLCKGAGLEWDPGTHKKTYVFRAAPAVEAKWIALQGTIDQVCDPPSTERFVAQVRGAETVVLPKVGHGFGVYRNWVPQLEQSFRRIYAPPERPAPPLAPEVGDLPLIELPVAGGGRPELAVIYSGDGGWASLDRRVGEVLQAEGMPVVGVSSLQYFWKARTPDGAAQDLERILRHYLTSWNRQQALLIGYSLGADVLPFMADRLPEELRQRVRLVALLGPSTTTSFEFHVSEWLGAAPSDELPVAPEVEKLAGTRILCFYGEEEQDSLCHALPPGLATLVPEKGAHHFGGDYRALARTILEAAAAPEPPPSAAPRNELR